MNPARITGVAVFVGGWAMAQLWLFWVAPVVGAVPGAAVYRVIGCEEIAGRLTPASVERLR